MGKKGAAAGADSKAAQQPASNAQQKPPRPSPGHKWDEEKQQWVGKGSLDERKAAKLKEAAAKEQADGTVLKSYQSMPTQLLADWAQREKRSRPIYSHAWAWDKSKFRQKVVLPDPKTPAKSLEFTPYDDSETLFVAKEHAAVLALLTVQASMPLERKLPEPYASVWKASVSGSKAPQAEAKPKAKPKARAEAAADDEWGSPTSDPAAASFAPPVRAASSYTSKAERDAAERKRLEERNRREAAKEMQRQANRPAPILLARKMRAHLYEVLGLQEAYKAAGPADETELDDVEAKAVTKCVDWGFEGSEAIRALGALREESAGKGIGQRGAEALAEEMRQWLCLHLPEEELPEEFSAARGQYQVYRSAAVADGGQSQGQELGSGGTGAVSEFDLACQALCSWLHEQLHAKLGSTDADALHASVEALIIGIDDPASASDEDMQEVVENAAAILSTEDGLDKLCEELQERWTAVCALRHIAVADAEKSEDPDTMADASTAADPSVISESVEDTSDSSLGYVETVFESGAAGSARDGTAGGQTSRSRSSAMWFGRRAGNSELKASESSWRGTAAGQRMQKVRDALPAAKSREALLQLSKENPVVLVQGETGCGKTTQVGQFLLDADASARIIVTQPRRVAATSVAHRVAEERGERLGEGAVGYSVRGESRLNQDRCRLLFCTNGVILRRILGDARHMLEEDTCTHLVVDEVHERSVEIDLLLCLLRHLLPSRPKLRVLLMSATMDVEQLAAMFSSCRPPPVVKIPGRTFPVAQLFIEDIKDQVPSWTWGGSSSSTKQPSADTRNSYEALQPLNMAAISEVVVQALRGELREVPAEGAILVFVAGVGEIEKVSRELQHRLSKGEASVLPLHGGLAPDQQRRCFQVPGAGAPRKIVVSTNVAETSVTVPDVTIVVDTARERRLEMQSGAVAALLAEGLCAKSSLQQRRGRAGRVRAGMCITLLTQADYSSLPLTPAPEIEAAPLESLCLQVLVAGFEPQPFLERMPTPPQPERVAASSRMLVRIGATVQAGEADAPAAAKAPKLEPTSLGYHLAALPCDVHVGKLLVVGAFLGIASMAIDVAAMLSVRSPLKSTAKDPQAEAWRQRLRQSLRPGGTKSDHCLYAKLLQLWIKGGSSERRDLCKSAAVVWERMAEAASVRSQLTSALSGLGFDARGGDDRCSGEWRALRVAVTAAFYPQVARVQRPPKEFTQGLSGAIEKEAEARRLRYWVTPEEAHGKADAEESSYRGGRTGRDIRAFLHPASMLFKEQGYSCPFVVFSAKQLQQTQGEYSSRLTLSELSEASVYALLLFGGELEVDHGKAEVVIDGWIRFGGNTTVVGLMERLRKEIDKLLLKKVEAPNLRLADEPVCQVVTTLLSTDGLG